MSEPGLSEVVAHVEKGDARAGRRQAARLISRDGAVAHPRLDRWLAMAVSSEDQALRAEACGLLARALYDRPWRLGEPELAVTRALLAVVENDRSTTALFAIAALSGVGDLLAANALLAAAKSSLSQHPSPREFTRLLVESIHRLNVGSSTSPVRPEHIRDCERHLHSCAQLLRSFPDLESWSDLVKGSMDAWFLTIRRWCDEVALPPPDPSSLLTCWPADPRIRAIARDSHLIEEISSGRWPFQGGARAFYTGMVLGLSKASKEQIESATAALLRNADVDIASVRVQILEGVAAGIAMLTGASSTWEPDVGTRLSDELIARPLQWKAPMSQLPGSSEMLARWDFQHEPIHCMGTADSVVGVAAKQVMDEDRPPVPFGWLGSPGRSSFIFEFDEPANMRRNRHLWIRGQKGVRGIFPWGGEAGIDVFLEGALQASWRDIGSTEERTIPLLLSGIEVGRRRKLEIRLSAHANTTFRLYEVRVQ